MNAAPVGRSPCQSAGEGSDDPIAAAHGSVETARRIAEDVAGPVRPTRSIARRGFRTRRSPRCARSGCSAPSCRAELGGLGATIGEVAASCEALGRACASTAMIYAMHQIEVACLVRHGLSSPFFRDYLAELARHEWLIASATSELGVGGDLRRSVCAVERDGSRSSRHQAGAGHLLRRGGGRHPADRAARA